MRVLGVSAGFHDAGLTVLHNDRILFAGHSERYSKKKHDKNLCPEIIEEAFKHGPFDCVAYYETPWKKKTREIYAGQGIKKGSTWTVKETLKKQFGDLYQFLPQNIKTFNHHMSHVASGFQTSPFQDATVVVIDAIGEWDTVSIWSATYNKHIFGGEYGEVDYEKLWSQKYPHSIGLYYSAMTGRLGLRPQDEEYILMGMAGWGKNTVEQKIKNSLIRDMGDTVFTQNLHTGVDEEFLKDEDEMNIAASTQAVVEKLIDEVMARAKKLGKSNNLVYQGGVALNCLYNRNLGKWWDNIWIMPNPGDAGSSLGAAAQVYKKHLRWQHPYLGTNIEGDYPVDELLNELAENKIVGVASGRAEFGPRALGNRSLLADPRGEEIKDQVNDIKRRQKFRPFAPIIMEEFVNQYFDMPKNLPTSPYMQVVADCKKPKEFPAIVHVDGTSRVQTVPKDSESGVRQLLEKWFTLTGCPMLLNTSLNIRGEPMVDTREDADRFEKEYKVKVCS
jgi:carbamoyltransferase